MLGVLRETEDGRLALRFERRFAHSPDKVWRAITETDQLRAWFVQILDYDRFRFEPAPGGAIEFVSTAGETGHGEFIQVDPPRLLEYTWDSEILRWELEPDGDGCRLIFTNIFDDRPSAASLGAGWHAGLELLASLLDGRRAGEPAWERLHADYERALD
jgi:uncharacterized protein YndB with AHSA1/START domain